MDIGPYHWGTTAQVCALSRSYPKPHNRNQFLDYAHGFWDSETPLGTHMGSLGEGWVLSQ